MSEEDVGDLILISFDSDGQSPYWGTCAGILLSGGKQFLDILLK